MNILEFIYNEKSINFDPTGDDNVMVNATEMAKAFDKRIDVFLKAEYIQEYIDALIKTLNKGREFPPNGGDSTMKIDDEFTPNGGNSKPITKDYILQTRGQNGTWMHRFLAIKFAAWMDPYFDIWITTTIDQILLGHYREVKEATFEKLEAERQYEEEKTQLMAKYPELGNLLVKQGLITEAEKKRAKALRAATDQLRFEFGNSQK